MANRVWHRLMGRGIVHPVDVMGNKPWSEDLLDYLAVYFAENGYDLKKLIEHIATSQAYQSKSVPLAKDIAGDGYVFRGPELKRLDAEQFIDAIWMLTGTAPANPSAEFAKAAAKVLPPFPESTPKERQFVRTTLVDCDPLMRSLGRPNREQVVTTRPDQLSTLQALDLANGQILAATLERGAANVLRANPKATPDELAEWVFVRALSRKPTPGELIAAKALLGDKPSTQSVADFLWVVVMLPEFQLVR
jgi:hypothetical protein